MELQKLVSRTGRTAIPRAIWCSGGSEKKSARKDRRTPKPGGDLHASIFINAACEWMRSVAQNVLLNGRPDT